MVCSPRAACLAGCNSCHQLLLQLHQQHCGVAHAHVCGFLHRSGAPPWLLAGITAASYIGNADMPALQAMGIALLHRERHGPSMLTDAGQVVLSYCESLLAVANEAWRTLADFRSANAGVVSIGASQTVATYLLPQLIAGFRMHNPQVGSWGRQPYCAAAANSAAGSTQGLACFGMSHRI